jgi:hypothetical protein
VQQELCDLGGVQPQPADGCLSIERCVRFCTTRGRYFSGSFRSSQWSVSHVARSMPGGKTAYAIRRPRRSGQRRKLVGHIKITRGTSSGKNAANVRAVRAPMEMPTTTAKLSRSRRQSSIRRRRIQAPTVRRRLRFGHTRDARRRVPNSRHRGRFLHRICIVRTCVPPCKINTVAAPRCSSRYSMT